MNGSSIFFGRPAFDFLEETSNVARRMASMIASCIVIAFFSARILSVSKSAGCIDSIIRLLCMVVLLILIYTTIVLISI